MQDLPFQALLDVLPPGSPEQALARALNPARIPRHIAIIMDGNGRWAAQRGMPRVAGHRAGADVVRTVAQTCARLGVEAVTLYAFSIENWKRPRTEVETLWRLLRFYLDREMAELQRNNIRLTAIGRLDALPSAVQRELESACTKTAGNTGMRLNLAINYGGRAELVDAVRGLLAEVQERGTEISEETLAAHLYTAGLPDPDLLIRTSGEMRVSNFLLWQIAYAELYVTDTLWPDFDRAELLRAILDYQKRERRFGGLNETAEETAAATNS